MPVLMGKIWSLKPMKSKKVSLGRSHVLAWVLMGLCCLLNYGNILAQVETRIEGALAMSQDRKGNIFIADSQGSLDVYDTTATRILNFASSNGRAPSHLEAWLTLKVFLYYEAFQEYVILDRFLNTSEPFGLNEELIGYASVASLSSEENIWLFDNTDFSLKKYEPLLDRLLVNTPLDLVLDPDDYRIVYMREYQNLLLLSDFNSGILLFDNLGNLKKKLDYPGVSYVGVLGNSLCFAQGKRFVVYDLYTQEERSVALPAGESWKFATLVPGKWVLVSDGLLKIMEIPPELSGQNDD